ncbi:MAG: Gfo/Idh/MocA family oxidoreductase [Planctomycetota bacterium]|nr:Gfo/Idh/MocA family oxidoreductase [Planctomycetota bacterium]
MAGRTASDNLRVGLIGAGMIAGAHSGCYRKMDGVTVAAVWDADRARAQKIAAAHNAAVCASREELLKACDVVDICLPTPFHLENIRAAAAAKKPVISEKPLGRSLEDCDAAIEACAKAKVPLLVGHVLRFFPEYSALRDIILSGRIGDPAVIHLRRVVCSPGGPGTWYWNYEASGGCVFDTAIHDLDWLLWTLGRPVSVYGLGHRDPANTRDYALITIQFPGGAIAHLQSSWAHDGFSTSFEAAGSEGLVEYDMEDAVPLKVAKIGGDAGGGGKVVPESPLAKSPYQLELEHFMDVIRGKAKPIITPAEARASVELALACLDAVAGKKVVTLSKGKAAPKAKAKAKKKVKLGAEHPE